MSVLYRVYTNNEHLLQELSLDGLRKSDAVIEAVLAEAGDPWEMFCSLLRLGHADEGSGRAAAGDHVRRRVAGDGDAAGRPHRTAHRLGPGVAPYRSDLAQCFET
ncbi:hypothetical protein OJ997_08675 [Solirubrobacter phytolaccae]|uniref:Uncharacterized protein n=1 Tax=Solirubrobacter phytolaccae TaxID=1404360 RepID=A0A9X3N639_9ACTN|nr:hypothetical protein [Solirubrobacter phytolaccae]MDA0180368.1 hypothetical protein [Solirubrobacter phytolaccae]